jgi:O-antigen/teichoic acid export membrane protein
LNTEQKIHISRSDIIWSYSAHIFNVGASIIILPAVLHSLPEKMLGVWYLFLTISTFVNLLDFGFRNTFMRNVSYTYGGATVLLKSGIDVDSKVLPHPNYSLLKEVIATMRRFYAMLSLLMFLLLAVAGSYYLFYYCGKLSLSPEELSEVKTAWWIYAFSTSLGFFLLYYNPLLVGRGLIKENNMVIIVSKVIYIVTVIAGLKYDMGLEAIVLATLLSVACNAGLSHFFFFDKQTVLKLKQTVREKVKLMPVFWHNASKVGIAETANFFTMQGATFFVSFFAPADVAQYGLTMQLVVFINTIGTSYFQTYGPAVAQYRVENAVEKIRTTFGESVVVLQTIYISAVAFILVFGNKILQLIGSNTELLPQPALILVFLTGLLATNHGIALQLLMSKNEIPYLKASVISGAGIIILCLVFGKLNWGVYTVIAAIGIVQLLYHNWKWPMEVTKDIRLSYPKLYERGFKSLTQKITKLWQK